MMSSKLFKGLKAGLEEVIAYKKGEIDLIVEEIEIPEPAAIYKSKEIQKIRKKNNYSQSMFAKALNVSSKTVQSWESGKRVPSHAALRLIELVDKGIYTPYTIKKV